MRRILKKLAFCLSLFVLTYDCAPPVQIVQAGTAHVHDANCYAGTIHAAHTGDCYEDVTVQKYCNGTYIYDGTVTDNIRTKEVLFGCADRSCWNYHWNWIYTIDSYTYLTGEHGTWYPSEYPTRCVCPGCGKLSGRTTVTTMWKYYFCLNRNCGYYYNGDINNSVDSTRYFPPLEGAPTEAVYCPGCGRLCGSTSREEAWAYNVDRYKCSVCGDTRYNAPQGYSHFSPQLSGQIHGAYTTTERQLKCDKTVGKYYDANGNECPCLCGKTVKTITAAAPEQVVRLGDPVNAKAFLELYNGQRVSGYECTVSGYDPNDLTGAWQEVTLTVKSSDYPYVYNSITGKREPGTASTKIRVKTYKPVHRLELRWNRGGEMICLSDDAEEESRGATSAVYVTGEGERVRIAVKPHEGYEFFGELSGKNVIFSERNSGYEYDVKMGDEDILLEAVFRPQRIDVTFAPEGGNWGGLSEKVKKQAAYGKTYASEHVFPPDPVKAGHVFGGWFDANGRRTENTDICLETKELMLHAGWTKFEGNSVNAEFEEVIPFKTPLAVSGFEFDSASFWRKEERQNNGYGECLLKGSVVKTLNALKLFGHWEAKEYTVFLDPNGGRTENNTESLKVRYHEIIGKLPKAEKEGAVFLGWFSEREDENGELTERITEDHCLTISGDLRLKAKWAAADGSTLKLSADVIRVNNGPVTKRNAAGIAVFSAGNRLEFETEILLPDRAKPPFELEAVPRYYALDPLTGLCEKAHVFSVSRVGDRIVTFYERGTDIEDGCKVHFAEREYAGGLHWTLPHLSFAVKDKKYRELQDYSAVSTLSGKEGFFEKNCVLKAVFDLKVTDSKGEKFETKDAMSVFVILE